MSDFMKAIPTEYKGIQLKSRMEAQCALLFDRLGWKWEYEPKSYMLKNGVAYMPDFYIPESEIVIECRGYTTEKGDAQISGFAKELRALNIDYFVVIGPDRATLYMHGRSPQELRLTYCHRCAEWTFANTGWQHATCEMCCELTFLEYAVLVADGKISFGSATSDLWKEELFSHDMQLRKWAMRFLGHYAESIGDYPLRTNCSRIRLEYYNGNELQFNFDQCGFTAEQLLRVEEIVRHIFASDKERAARGAEPHAD